MVIIICPSADTHRTTEENLGAEYIVSFLRSRGVEVVFIDAWLCNLGNEDVLKIIKRVKHPVLVGLSVSMDSCISGNFLAQRLKNLFPNVHITIGGYKPTFSAEELLCSCSSIDSVCFGEGEFTILELYTALSSKRDWKGTRGLIYLDEVGEVVRNEPRALINNLDNLPFPSRDFIVIVRKKKTPVHISASRGCYGNCAFCSINAFYGLCSGEKWRSRSIKNIIEEISILNKVYGVNSFKFVDDNFFSSKGADLRVDEFCKLIKLKKLNIEFRISARANDVTEERFAKLKEAGLYSVSIGVESGNQKSLDLFNKGIVVSRNYRAMKILRKLGIYVQMGFILFNPLTDIESLVSDYKFLFANKEAITKGIFSSLFLAEGTPITDKFVKIGVTRRKSGSNYVYEPMDKKAAIVFRDLKLWATENSALRDKVIDPLSAPKIISENLRPLFLVLCVRIKKYDLCVFNTILKMVCAGAGEKAVKEYVCGCIDTSARFWQGISKEVNVLYSRAGIEYNAGRNKYII